jgi:hypothetical protein
MPMISIDLVQQNGFSSTDLSLYDNVQCLLTSYNSSCVVELERELGLIRVSVVKSGNSV